VNLEYGRLLSRGFSITWRHRWLWLLGLFAGGGGGSFNYSQGTGRGGNGGAVGDFIAHNIALILLGGAIILVLVLVAVIISFIARPAAIWAALQLDAGNAARLGQAWRFGRSRAGRMFRLSLLMFLVFLGVAVAIGVLVLVDVVLFQVAVALGVIALIPLVIGGIAVLVILGLGLRWAPYAVVVLDLAPREALGASWNLFWRHKLDTFVIGLLLGVVTFGIAIASFVVAALVSVPGIVMLVMGFQGAGNSLLIGAGALWVILLGGAVLVATSGFLGALDAVVDTLACRDLCWMDGMAPRVEGLPEAPPVPQPGMMPPPTSWVPTA